MGRAQLPDRVVASFPKTAAAIASAAVIGGAAFVAGSQSNEPQSVAESPICDATGTAVDSGACGAQGVILHGLLYNIQGAVQFCKWKAANPGEWSRLQAYLGAPSTSPPGIVVTWFGAALRDAIQAYSFAYGQPAAMPIPAPNACGGKLIAPPTNVQVTGP